jgi:hypothetical protein
MFTLNIRDKRGKYSYRYHAGAQNFACGCPSRSLWRREAGGKAELGVAAGWALVHGFLRTGRWFALPATASAGQGSYLRICTLLLRDSFDIPAPRAY